MENRTTFGFTPSKMDGTEHHFNTFETLEIPDEYSYVDFLSPVINQGQTNTCVPSSISAHLNWNKNVDTDGENHRDNHVSIKEIYSARTGCGDCGMTFKDALHFLLHTGCSSDLGKLKIRQYALVGSELALKQALLLNGPCVCGMMVYNMGPKFWDRTQFENNYGGHATAIVGYNKYGFIIRNSWGTEWANSGYSILPYDEYRKYMLECWTIID